MRSAKSFWIGSGANWPLVGRELREWRESLGPAAEQVLKEVREKWLDRERKEGCCGSILVKAEDRVTKLFSDICFNTSQSALYYRKDQLVFREASRTVS